MSSLDAQNVAMKEGGTLKQHVVATLTATVAVAALAVIDGVLQAAIFVVKTPFTFLKVTVGNLFSIGQYPALEAKEWFAHATRVYKCFVLLVNAALVGAYSPTSISALGHTLGILCSKPSEASKEKEGAVVVAPSGTSA